MPISTDKTLASEGVQERLFRDDVGAALERVRRLEQENQALRAEIDHIKSGRPSPVPFPYRIGTVALCIATIAVGASLAFTHAVDPPPFTEPLYTPAPPPPRTVAVPHPPVTAGSPLQPNCNPPYYSDANGIRVFKKECL